MSCDVKNVTMMSLLQTDTAPCAAKKCRKRSKAEVLPHIPDILQGRLSLQILRSVHPAVGL